MKRNMVREIMEKKLSPYGFAYVGYELLCWTFAREMNGVKQYVVIQKSNWGDSYYLEIYTSSNQYPLRIPEITGDLTKFENLDYHNETEQREVLNELADIVIKYGLERFNTIKPVKIYKATPEMHQKLFEEEKNLTKNFLQRHQYESINDERVLMILQQEINMLQGKEYEEVQDRLVELAAVYGNLVIESMGGEWENRNGKTYIGQVPLHFRIHVLLEIVRGWAKLNDNVVVLWYTDSLESLYSYIDNGRKTNGSDWLPPKLKRGLINMEKLDSRRTWAKRIADKYRES